MCPACFFWGIVARRIKDEDITVCARNLRTTCRYGRDHAFAPTWPTREALLRRRFEELLKKLDRFETRLRDSREHGCSIYKAQEAREASSADADSALIGKVCAVGCGSAISIASIMSYFRLFLGTRGLLFVMHFLGLTMRKRVINAKPSQVILRRRPLDDDDDA